MALFNIDLSVTVEADDFESALMWLDATPLNQQIDYDVIDYNEIEVSND